MQFVDKEELFTAHKIKNFRYIKIKDSCTTKSTHDWHTGMSKTTKGLLSQIENSGKPVKNGNPTKKGKAYEWISQT